MQEVYIYRAGRVFAECVQFQSLWGQYQRVAGAGGRLCLVGQPQFRGQCAGGCGKFWVAVADDQLGHGDESVG